MKNTKEKITLFDRLAVSFFSAILAFITGLLVWLLIGSPGTISFNWVYGFTVFLAALGFLNLQNTIVKVLGLIWKS